MGLRDKLSQASNRFRKLRLSLGPDSYFHYRRKRKYERKQADHAREHARGSAELERETVERERDYEQRYRREREMEITRKRTESAEEIEPTAEDL